VIYEELKKLAKENKTRYAILGVLSMYDASGYDIKKFCDQGIVHFWNENFGHIYPVLKQLLSKGLIVKKPDNDLGKASRIVYSITPEGREELLNWLIKPVEHNPVRLELLLKLTFAKNVSYEVILNEIERIKCGHIKRLQDTKKIERGLVENDKLKKDAGYPYWLSTVRYGIYDAEFRVKWCEDTINNIKTWLINNKGGVLE
jgi:DNA-binding PadR family transcriptional regulator